MDFDLILSKIAQKGKDDFILVEGNIDFKRCRFCDDFVSVSYYKSKEAEEKGVVYLHKACGDLPLEMEHQQHSGHTLRICEVKTYGRCCNVCQTWSHRMCYYGCSDCKEFVVCIGCALQLFPIAYKYHQHPLITIHHDYPGSNCLLCRGYSSGISYKCTTCLFHVHQACLSSPRILRLPFHRHDLKLIYSFPESGSGGPTCCQICQEDMKEEKCAYYCARCRSFFHLHNCRPMVHFSHDHPLALVEEGEEKATYGTCYGCQMKISVPYYYCSTDHKCHSFRLHKSCAELPENVEHHLHPGHALKISTVNKSICNACYVPWQGFTYSCTHAFCFFTIDIICSTRTLHKHKFHQHQLIPSPMKAPLACHACDRDSEGTTFQCTTCRFWVHQQCASLPTSRKYDLHPHELKLIYSLPDSLRESREHFYCNACREEIQPHNWAYHCAGCRHFTHVHSCRKIKEFDSDAVLANAVHLPMGNESVSLATLFFMDTNEEEGNEVESKLQDTNGIKGRQRLFLDPNKNCDKSTEFLAAPCNNCVMCKYFLPKPPLELLKLGTTQLGYLSKVKPADEQNCRAFTLDCQRNMAIINISSSILPRYVKHEGHDHVLSTTYVTRETWCNACEKDFTGYGFRCNFCGFTIDTYCALLPGSFSHRCDKEHPFKLTYFSIVDVKEYVCEICEEDITTMWFYHCVECDHSIHPRCIWKIHIMFGPFIIGLDSRKFTMAPAATSNLPYKWKVQSMSYE